MPRRVAPRVAGDFSLAWSRRGEAERDAPDGPRDTYGRALEGKEGLNAPPDSGGRRAPKHPFQYRNPIPPSPFTPR